MSNPAVTKLVRGDVGGLNFWMDDNIGESIHVHLADFRLDLTLDGLHDLSEELKDTLNALVAVEGFDCRALDPVFLSRMLAPLLKDLVAVKIDTVSLGQLKVCYDKGGFTKYTDIPHSRAYKALNGDDRENNDNRNSHHVGQTSAQRLSAMRDSVAQNGYPFNGQYIILYNDQMLVRDGQHRASCLYHERGDAEVPVMRLYFKEGAPIGYVESRAGQFFAKLKGFRVKSFFRFLGRIPGGIFRRLRRVGKSLSDKAHSRARQDMRKVYFQ